MFSARQLARPLTRGARLITSEAKAPAQLASESPYPLL